MELNLIGQVVGLVFLIAIALDIQKIIRNQQQILKKLGESK